MSLRITQPRALSQRPRAVQVTVSACDLPEADLFECRVRVLEGREGGPGAGHRPGDIRKACLFIATSGEGYTPP